jgi:hypothetical protein
MVRLFEAKRIHINNSCSIFGYENTLSVTVSMHLFLPLLSRGLVQNAVIILIAEAINSFQKSFQ